VRGDYDFEAKRLSDAAALHGPWRVRRGRRGP
jgi:hypothetical protein